MIHVSLQETVAAVIGGSVLLPCSSTEEDHKPQDFNVHWRHNGSELVYDIVNGENSLELQNLRYKNRTECFPQEFERGNFSIKLNNLTLMLENTAASSHPQMNRRLYLSSLNQQQEKEPNRLNKKNKEKQNLTYLSRQSAPPIGKSSRRALPLEPLLREPGNRESASHRCNSVYGYPEASVEPETHLEPDR
ncbi:butyrophilin-like protein [Pimephales promelas]|nr:butyrophilin-like protein [Pimephales promelas]